MKESAAMADDDSTPEEVVTVQEAPATDAPDDDEVYLGDKGKRALDRMKAQLADAERRAKVHADAAARLKQIEDAQKSEAERFADRLATAEREAATARTEVLRYRVAAEHGISSEDAEMFLTGGDEESLTRQAERLAARDADRKVAEEQQRKNGAHVPREGHGVSTHDDPDSAALSILGFGG